MKESNYRTIRSHVLFAMRTFFHDQGFIEVETPSLTSSLIPERHIAVHSIHDEREKKYLIPSPEIHLKPLLATLYAEKQDVWKLYEFAHSFRKEEVNDFIHAHEFLMLEWYCVNADVRASRDLCIELLQVAVESSISYGTPALAWMDALLAKKAIVTIRMSEAFMRYAHVDLCELVHAHSVSEAWRIAHMSEQYTNDTYDWEDIFHKVFIDRVEPQLPRDALVFITDYPSRVQTLAKKTPDTPWAERWELYINGIEIANCYCEETNPAIIQSFFKSQAIDTKTSARREVVPHPVPFLENPLLPSCSGVALGIDRLLMVLCGRKAI